MTDTLAQLTAALAEHYSLELVEAHALLGDASWADLESFRSPF